MGDGSVNSGEGDGKGNWNEFRLERLWDAMFGNGKEGVILRLDRVEQSRLSAKERWAIYIGPLFSGLLVAVVPLIWSWLATKF